MSEQKLKVIWMPSEMHQYMDLYMKTQRVDASESDHAELNRAARHLLESTKPERIDVVRNALANLTFAPKSPNTVYKIIAERFCDGCGFSPLEPPFDRCLVCVDYDLCRKCGEQLALNLTTGSHKIDHTTVPILTQEDVNRSVQDFKLSRNLA